MTLLAALVTAAFVGLAARLAYLQVVRHEPLRVEARKNTEHLFIFEPRRGDILDARRNSLATSLIVKTICADPTLVGNQYPVVARALAPILQTNEAALAERLMPQGRRNDKGQWITNRYVVLKRKVTVEDWQRIQQTMTNLQFGVDEKTLTRTQRAFLRDVRNKSVFPDTMDDQLRTYPNHALACHVLGFVGMGTNEFDDKIFMETRGQEGVELTFDSDLRGVRGWRMTELDRRRREIPGFRTQDVAPRDGLNVVMTIDSVLQYHVEMALAEAVAKHTPISASAIVVRPRTGEILAMATLPNFDPNDPGGFQAASRRNRTICDMIEPGSTFKIVAVSGALNEHAMRLTDRVFCENGRWAFARETLHDHDAYGWLTVEQIITKSSNIGAAKVAIELGEQNFFRYITEFGIGRRTGIPLVGEAGGYVRPLNRWTQLSISRVAMGHEVMVTPLQMVMTMSAIANGGTLMRPMLVDRLEDQAGNTVVKYPPQAVRRVISPESSRLMVQALKTVVTKDGTAAEAAMEHYSVAGKTGTAQKVENRQYVKKYYSSFIGFFPAENPELCIGLFFDDPHNGYYGGRVAAPFWKEIAVKAANYLNVKPDLFDTNTTAELLTASTDPHNRIARVFQNRP
jgi:cell division protein FtsI/penicillin-binding protein 2